MKKYIALLWLCCLTVGIRAAVQIKAAAPDVVEEGEQFRLSFTMNTQDVSNFHLPTLKGFSVDMGPSRSSQSSFQMINGKTSQSSSVTYTYILSALKAGTYTIPAATATVNGKQYRSHRGCSRQRRGSTVSPTRGRTARTDADARCRG